MHRNKYIIEGYERKPSGDNGINIRLSNILSAFENRHVNVTIIKPYFALYNML